MKRTLLSFIFALTMLAASAANKPVVWQKPYYVSTTISRFNLQSVELNDTATIITAQIKSPEIIISSDFRLDGEDGKSYKVKYCKEFALDAPIPIDDKGVASMTLVFEPMPLTTSFFDMLEGLGRRQDRVMGISDTKNPVQIKPYALNEEKINELRKDFFHTDTACIKGKVKGSLLSNGITSFNVSHYNCLTGESEPIDIQINEDGTFEQKFVLHYPIFNYLGAEDAPINIPFFIKPGETLNFDINWHGSAEVKTIVTDSSGKPAPYSALSTKLPLYNRDSRCKALRSYYNLGFKSYSKHLEEAYNAAITTHDYLAARYHYNDIEYLLGKLEIQYGFALDLVSYEMGNDKVRSSYLGQELPDSISEVFNPENYSFLRKIPYNDIISLCVWRYYGFSANYGDGRMINEGLIDCPASMVDEIIMSRDKEVFGEKNISLPFIIHYLADFYKQGKKGKHNYLNIKSELMNKFFGNSLDVKVEEAIAEIKRRANAVKAEMHNPMFEALIDKYVDAGLNDKILTYTLPDCDATNILRKITDKYKGKYVYLDFWATFCAPCRSGIEQSKAWREEVRNNPDFEFVYITGDKSSPKTTYEEYVAQNLNGAECYRIPEEDYKKLKVLFKFTGFPHYEALDPNGNVLKVNNTYYEGKDVFLRKIETMKRMQEK